MEKEIADIAFAHRFEPIILLEQFRAIFPTNDEPQMWVDLMNEVLPYYNITSKPRVAMFLSQCGHESLNFTRLSENLNYSTQGLANTWSRYSSTGKLGGPPNALARSLNRKPQAIANDAYANRMGNGDAASGDGWRFKGRGLIMTTGKNNYRVVSRELFGDDRLLTDPDLLQSPLYALKSACVFWKNNDLNEFADNQDIEGATRRINGGLIGLAHRKDIYNEAMVIL